jgi:hypothetical protein
VHEHDRPAFAAGNRDATSILSRTHIGKIPSLDLAHQERQIRAFFGTGLSCMVCKLGEPIAMGRAGIAV